MQTATAAQTPKSIWNKNFILAMLVSALSGLSNGMLSPALPIYAGSLGYGTDVAGTIVAIATFLCMFGRGLCGGWADRTSRKKILGGAFLASTAAFVLFCFAGNFPLLLAAKCIQGISSGIIITVLSTVAYDALPPALLGSGIGIYSLASSLAQCIAPSIGTSLAHANRYPALFLCSAAAALASFFVLLIVPIQPTERARAYAEAKKNGTLQKRGFHISDYLCCEALPAAGLLLMNGVICAAVTNYLAICGLSRGITAIATFFTINSVVLIISRPLLGRLADKKPLSWLIVPGYLLMAAGCALIAMAQNMIPICIAGALYGVGFGAAMSSAQLAAIRSVDTSRRGVANSTYYVGGDIGLTLGAYAAGALAAGVGYTVMYYIIAASSILTLILYLLYKARRRASASASAAVGAD